jgi:hypothetical protein
MSTSAMAYVPPLSLTILGAIFLLIGAISAVFITLDILIQQGWRRMMGIMYALQNLTQDPDVYHNCALSGTRRRMALLEVRPAKKTGPA